MEYKRIVELAHHAALVQWGIEWDKLQENPGNEIEIAREKRAKRELEEIGSILFDLVFGLEAETEHN